MKLGRIAWAISMACLTALAAAPGALARGDAGGVLLSPHDRAVYTVAFGQAKARQYRRALALVQARGATDPTLTKVLRWLALSAPAPTRIFQVGNFEAIVAFQAANPDWPGQAALGLRAEEAMPETLPDAAVLAWFAARPPRTARGGARYAAALLRAGDQARATQVVRQTWIEGDFPPRDEAAFRKRYAKLLRRQDHLARLDRLLWDRRTRPARRMARRLGGGYPALAEARLRLARGRGGVDGAIRLVPAALRRDPGLIYERARWRKRRGRYDGVIELLDPPAPDMPHAARWWPLRDWAARQALLRGDVSVAYRMSAGHGPLSGAALAKAEWLAGWIALRFLDEPNTAYAHFERFLGTVATPVSIARGAYWAGEAASALETRDPAGPWRAVARMWYAAAARHGTAFYGQVASLRQGRHPVFAQPPARTHTPTAWTAAAAGELARVARMLGEIGESDLQKRFLLRLRVLAETPGDYARVVELAISLGRPDLGLRAARAARGDGIILMDPLFPEMALPVSDGLEPALLLALIRQESGFYPAARSPSGARGLMQILPRTARQVARRLKVRFNRDRLISDPAFNLRLGRAYLREMLERFDGSYVLALAAYNAGPARVERWRAALGDPRDPEVDVLDWIESLPVDQTRNYVQRILEALAVYRDRLDMGAAALPVTGAPLPTAAARWRVPAADGNAPGAVYCCQ